MFRLNVSFTFLPPHVNLPDELWYGCCGRQAGRWCCQTSCQSSAEKQMFWAWCEKHPSADTHQVVLHVLPVHGVAFLWSVPLCCMWGVFSSVIVGKTRCRAGRPLGQTRNPASSYLIIMFLSASVNKTQPLPRLGIGGVTVSQALCGKLIQCFQGAQKAWGVKMI